jgi:lipopolysaccharide export system protein LptC
LEEQVRVWREPLPKLAGLQVSTDHLDIWPDDQRLDTDQPVSLIQGNSTIQARRLHADNLSGVLELGGGVSATLAPRH